MANSYDVDTNELLEVVSKKLQDSDNIKAPEWALFCKTGVSRERPPTRDDWWYIRSAAILRSVRKLGPVGVAKLRKKYGGKQRRGHKPARFRTGSGNIIRKILQQLRSDGLIEQKDVNTHKGNVITGKGMSLLDKSAKECTNGKK